MYKYKNKNKKMLLFEEDLQWLCNISFEDLEI